MKRSFSRVEALQELLGHKFARPALLKQALTHSSAEPERLSVADRLEFLGDRVLGLVIADILLRRFPDEAEGELARRLNALVDGRTCTRMACETGLDRYVRTGSGEMAGRGYQTVLADMMEAVIGALYLDGGLHVARDFILTSWESELSGQVQPPQPPKSALQEWAQARGESLPVYELLSRKGAAHAPIFRIRVRVCGYEGEAEGGSLQEAESGAAAGLLARIMSKGEGESSCR